MESADEPLASGKAALARGDWASTRRHLEARPTGPRRWERIRATDGVNFDRLVDLKSKHDPENLFRANRNILPRLEGAR